jgi:hypothetical protein
MTLRTDEYERFCTEFDSAMNISIASRATFHTSPIEHQRVG